MSTEIEAKYSVPDLVTYTRLRAQRALAEFVLDDGQDQEVRDTYHDTPGRALLAAGVALRFRDLGGRLLVTMKSLTPVAGPVHEREEMEMALERFAQPAEWPDGELRTAVLAAAEGASLDPLFEVCQRRFVRHLTRDGRAVAEMSLDQVRLVAGQKEREYCECEVELLPQGTREDLAEVIRALEGEAALSPAPRSKFEEGLLLLDTAERETTAPKARARRAPPGGAPSLLRLEAPAGTTEETVLAELKRIGYRFRIRSRREEARLYLDTQAGSLLRQGMELYFEAVDSTWHLLRAGRRVHVEKGERASLPGPGALSVSVESAARGKACFPWLEAELREDRLSVESLSSGQLRMSVRAWRFRAVFHDVPGQEALTVVLDRGRASDFDKEYLAELLKNALGLREPDHGVLALGLQRLGVPLPGASLPSEFLADPSDDMGSVCRKILAGEAWRMRANTPGARRDLDPEFVHDLRVATRRARFACRLFAASLGEQRQGMLRAELAWIAAHLGAVRDLDVFRGRLASQLSLVDARPIFSQTLMGLLDSQRSQARDSLLEALGSERYSSLLDAMSSVSPQAAVEGKDAGKPVVEIARRRIGKALGRIVPWTGRKPEELSADEIHRLRILFKRLRYTAEFFRPIVGEEAAALVKECVVFQDCLGAHQDARVAAEMLSGLALEGALRDSPALLLSLGALIQVQRDAMSVQRGRFSSLWRTASDQFGLRARQRFRRTGPP